MWCLWKYTQVVCTSFNYHYRKKNTLLSKLLNIISSKAIIITTYYTQDIREGQKSFVVLASFDITITNNIYHSLKTKEIIQLSLFIISSLNFFFFFRLTKFLACGVINWLFNSTPDTGISLKFRSMVQNLTKLK